MNKAFAYRSAENNAGRETLPFCGVEVGRALLPVLCLTGKSARPAIRRKKGGSVRPSFRHRSRAGLSLLEVILAIAILGGCVAVIGELVRLGARQAEEARELTTAQLLCESKLEEIAAGVVAPEAVGGVPFETDPRWQYAIEVASLDTPDLIQVTVSAQQVDGSRQVPLSFSLTRWMIDPNLELELSALESESSGEMSTGGSSSQSTSGTTAGGS